MNAEERRRFLADKHVAVIAVDRDGSAPLAVPVWYRLDESGDLVVWTERGTVKERLVRASGRFSLVVQDEDPRYRYVSVSGEATIVEEATVDDVRPIAQRYLGDDEVESYLAESYNDRVVLLRMSPSAWYSADFGKSTGSEADTPA
jgi:PPOX class probable F420-dependent enzyme